MSYKNRSMPSLHSDEAAEDFVATVDLTRYDLSGFKPMRFEIEPKAAALNMRLPASLLRPMSHRRGKVYSDQNRGDRAM